MPSRTRPFSLVLAAALSLGAVAALTPPAAAAAAPPLAINAGGGAVTGATGLRYVADRNFRGGSTATVSTVAGTSAPPRPAPCASGSPATPCRSPTGRTTSG